MSFVTLGLSEALVRAITAVGYDQPTPVQQQTIPAVLQGRDLMVAAQTGTGKTASFALPILELLFPSGQTEQTARATARPRVLVLAPTRELAAQVHDSFRAYAQQLPLRSACIFGGVGQKPQVEALAAGVDLLVACPGRLLDLSGQNSLDLSGVEILVLDEADRMLDMGFIHDVRKVLQRLPAKRQNLLFSATFSPAIIELANGLLDHPERIEITPPNTTVERIDQCVFRIAASHKRALLAHLITLGAWEQVLVFTRTKHGANRLTEYLNKQGLSAAAIHGNKSQNARTKSLADFKSGALRILVATDIAARGLDIDQLPHVVNFELPHVVEDYVHRIGRTGRAGRDGEAVSLVAPDEERLLRAIERVTRQNIPEGDWQGFEIPQQGSTEAPAPEAQPQVSESTESSTRKKRNRRGTRKPQGQERPQGADKAASADPGSAQERDPEEFLDDDFDNFGNRVDYVSPVQARQKNGQARKKPVASAAGTGAKKPVKAAAPGKPPAGGKPRTKKPQKPMVRNLARPEPRFTGFYDEQPLTQAPKASNKQPLIIRKGEKLPTLEQLNELDNRRPAGERPALLSRQR